MTLYKINISHRNYSSWSLFCANTLEPITIENFQPCEHPLFNGDVFTYNKGKVEIVHSTTRINEHIPAVLILSDKTYGRENRGTGKLLYKCIPDDIRIPIFLVPYEKKK